MVQETEEDKQTRGIGRKELETTEGGEIKANERIRRGYYRTSLEKYKA